MSHVAWPFTVTMGLLFGFSQATSWIDAQMIEARTQKLNRTENLEKELEPLDRELKELGVR